MSALGPIQPHDLGESSRDSRMRLRLAKRYVIVQNCPRRGAEGDFKNFEMHLRLLINVLRNAVFQTKRMEIATFLADSHWEMLQDCWTAADHC